MKMNCKETWWAKPRNLEQKKKDLDEENCNGFWWKKPERDAKQTRFGKRKKDDLDEDKLQCTLMKKIQIQTEIELQYNQA